MSQNVVARGSPSAVSSSGAIQRGVPPSDVTDTNCEVAVMDDTPKSVIRAYPLFEMRMFSCQCIRNARNVNPGEDTALRSP